MKYKGEELQKITECLKRIDCINDLDAAYCEDEERILFENVHALTKKKPMIWQNKGGNRSQCYANMYSKLLLGFLLKEIQQGTLLEKSYLDKIGNCCVTTFCDFYYDDCGKDTTAVLEKILQQVIEAKGYFKRDYEPVDITNVIEAEYNDGEREEELIQAISRAFPLLKPKLLEANQKEHFWNICNYPVLESETGVELEIIESQILYEIQQREAAAETEEGSSIVKLSDQIFYNLLQSDYIYDFLYWKIEDDKNRKIYYCLITCSDMYGDEVYWPLFINERLHRYSYYNVFKLIDLQDRIGEYQRKYLN